MARCDRLVIIHTAVVAICNKLVMIQTLVVAICNKLGMIQTVVVAISNKLAMIRNYGLERKLFNSGRRSDIISWKCPLKMFGAFSTP